MAHKITLGQSDVKVTDVLTLISRGYNYGQIINEYPDLTISDIMTCAAFAAELLTSLVDSDGDLQINGKIMVTAKSGKIVNLTKLRDVYPRAYEKWTLSEENQLVDLFHRAQKIADIAKILKRQPGAIRARLEKLGLTEPK